MDFAARAARRCRLVPVRRRCVSADAVVTEESETSGRLRSLATERRVRHLTVVTTVHPSGPAPTARTGGIGRDALRV